MRKKSFIIVLLIVIVALAVGFTVFGHSKTSEVSVIGSNVNGSVEKIVTGNLNSNETAVIILGVHPREHEIHEAVNSTMENITKNNNNLSKRFVIYYIVVHDDIKSRADTRAAGEGLANQFIVPDIKNVNPFVVVDVHEIDQYYEYASFVFPLSDNPKSHEYINILTKAIGVKEFDFNGGTSPELVTKPIADQGYNTLLFEASINDDIEVKKEMAKKLIYGIDSLTP